MRVLVVDDTDIQLDELRQVAEQAGAIVLSGRSTEEALQLIQQNEFDVVITDILFGQKPTDPSERIKMARRDGFRVLNAAKEHDPLCQIIVVTNYGEVSFGIEAMRLGAFDYLERSNDLIDFRLMLNAKITRAMDYRETKLELAGRG